MAAPKRNYEFRKQSLVALRIILLNTLNPVDSRKSVFFLA
jgi:hypothetical protein